MRFGRFLNAIVENPATGRRAALRGATRHAGEHLSRRTIDNMPTDILYVATGTTTGLLRGDDSFLRALDACGVSVKYAIPSYSLPRGTRRLIYRSLLTIDVHQCLALRSATARALRRDRPRAVIYTSSIAAMLAPHAIRTGAFAIRFDTPARLGRPESVFAHEHWLEQRRFRDARMLLPWGNEVAPEIASVLPTSTSVVALPIPIDRPPLRHDREPFAIAYAGSPDKKGLDLVVRAWSLAPVGDRKLIVAGIEAGPGRRFLHQRGVAEPQNVEWLGLIPPDDFRALTQRAELYVAASRYENYGIAQLEALADGALLVTLPSPGPYVAKGLNRALAPALVGSSFSAEALADSLEAAIQLTLVERDAYRARAHEMLQAHSQEHLEARIRSDVLPVLLR